jgi:hypothetical protein
MVGSGGQGSPFFDSPGLQIPGVDVSKMDLSASSAADVSGAVEADLGGQSAGFDADLETDLETATWMSYHGAELEAQPVPGC